MSVCVEFSHVVSWPAASLMWVLRPFQTVTAFSCLSGEHGVFSSGGSRLFFFSVHHRRTYDFALDREAWCLGFLDAELTDAW